MRIRAGLLGNIQIAGQVPCPLYPGIRTSLPDDYVEILLPALLPLLREIYAIPDAFEHELIRGQFSLITTPPEDLGVLQRVPHIDDMKSRYFATVHYLNAGTYAGTGIFRHRPTGFERISDERYPDFVAAAEAYIKANGLPAAGYIDASTDHFELIEEIEYKTNRLLIYPGNLLFCTPDSFNPAAISAGIRGQVALRPTCLSTLSSLAPRPAWKCIEED